MCDKELLVGYLYDELPAPERATFEEHLNACADCRQEVRALRGARVHLASWAPVEPDLGFEVVAARGGASRRFRVSPAWGLAAAATLVLATASAIANVELRVGSDGVALRTGWAQDAADAGANDGRATGAGLASGDDVAAIQQRVRELEAALARLPAEPAASPVGLASTGELTDAELLRRVRQWITESEQRQQQQLATRLVQGMREIQAAHSMDLVRLERAMNQHQGVWTDEVFRQREEMKQVYRLVNAQQR